MIFLLDDQNPSLMPEVEKAEDNGMLAVSQDLGIERLTAAYHKGIFPWMKMDQEPHYWCWFSPDPRMVLQPCDFKISRSLKKAIKSEKFEVRIDCSLEETMRSCAQSSRPEQESTWIEEDMIQDYLKLHRLGITHSVEAFIAGKRVGGLYGLAMGKMFFGGIHVSSSTRGIQDLSEPFIVTLSLQYGIQLIDCQAHTPHLEKMGAKQIPETYFQINSNFF